MPEKELCLNRLPVEYQPDAPAPTKWLEFLDGLLIPEDILTLQEYLGYLLIPSTKAQKDAGHDRQGRRGKIPHRLAAEEAVRGSLSLRIHPPHRNEPLCQCKSGV